MAVATNLKVLERVRLRKVRRLSVPGDVLVKVGDLVSPETIIAKTEFVRGNPRIIDLNAEFRKKVTPEEVDKYVHKKVGDTVQAKELIASYQKSFWSEITEVRSPCDGVIEYISRTQARIVIREDPRSAKPISIVPVASKLSIWPWLIRMFTQVNEGDYVYEGQVLAAAQNISMMDYVYAPMAGVVEKICPKTGTITIVRPIKPTQVLSHLSGKVTEVIKDYGAVVEAVGAYLEGIFGIGGERFGELAVAADSPSSVLDEAGVASEHKGKVLVSGSLVTLEALRKARALGVKGVISGGMNNVDLVQMLGREINVGLTGQEQTDFTVIVMDGFGAMPMNERSWNLLVSKAGLTASIDGTTQIRAGVIRPQVLISEGADGLDQVGGEPVGMAKEEPLPRMTNLAVGDVVRCVRRPYAGLKGVVEEIPPEPERVQCESVMEVARVRLDDGRLVTVPEANLEILTPKSA